MRPGIYLMCLSCAIHPEGKFSSVLKLISSDGEQIGEPILVMTPSPMQPGRAYELLVKGPFPGFQDNRPCLGELHYFYMAGSSALNQIDPMERHEETGILKAINGGN